MLVRFENIIYRLPVRPAMDKEKFDRFKERNKRCEVLIFALSGGYQVVPIESLEYHDTYDDRLH